MEQYFLEISEIKNSLAESYDFSKSLDLYPGELGCNFDIRRVQGESKNMIIITR